MHILQSKIARYGVSLALSTILLGVISYATYSDTYAYTCSDGKVGCDSQKTFGWPMPITTTSVNGTIPPQYQKESTSIVLVGIVANAAVAVVLSLGIERVLRLTQKK